MDSWEIQFSPSATEGTLICHAGNSGTSCCCTGFAVCSLSRSPVCTCAGAALGEQWRGVLILLFLFPSLAHNPQVQRRHVQTQHRSDRQLLSAAQIPTAAPVKASALVTARGLTGTTPRSRLESAGGVTVPRCHGGCLAVSSLRVFARGSCKVRPGRSQAAPAASGEDQRTGPVLTFRMSSLAEWDIRILSHQAGHLVFMYCFPWLESSLYG